MKNSAAPGPSVVRSAAAQSGAFDVPALFSTQTQLHYGLDAMRITFCEVAPDGASRPRISVAMTLETAKQLRNGLIQALQQFDVIDLGIPLM